MSKVKTIEQSEKKGSVWFGVQHCMRVCPGGFTDDRRQVTGGP